MVKATENPDTYFVKQNKKNMNKTYKSSKDGDNNKIGEIVMTMGTDDRSFPNKTSDENFYKTASDFSQQIMDFAKRADAKNGRPNKEKDIRELWQSYNFDIEEKKNQQLAADSGKNLPFAQMDSEVKAFSFEQIQNTVSPPGQDRQSRSKKVFRPTFSSDQNQKSNGSFGNPVTPHLNSRSYMKMHTSYLEQHKKVELTRTISRRRTSTFNNSGKAMPVDDRKDRKDSRSSWMGTDSKKVLRDDDGLTGGQSREFIEAPQPRDMLRMSGVDGGLLNPKYGFNANPDMRGSECTIFKDGYTNGSPDQNDIRLSMVIQDINTKVMKTEEDLPTKGKGGTQLTKVKNFANKSGRNLPTKITNPGRTRIDLSSGAISKTDTIKNKGFGGRKVFTSVDIDQTCKEINNLKPSSGIKPKSRGHLRKASDDIN
jgi:hypothetical protein